MLCRLMIVTVGYCSKVWRRLDGHIVIRTSSATIPPYKTKNLTAVVPSIAILTASTYTYVRIAKSLYLPEGTYY